MSDNKTTFTETEVRAAALTRDLVIKEGPEGLKGIYMAGEICMWVEMRDEIAYFNEEIARERANYVDACAEISRLREAIQEFVDRCERGEIRSVKTYAKFVELLRPKE